MKERGEKERISKFTRQKKGQVTIFVIIAILLISAIVLFFVFRTQITPQKGESVETNINSFLSSCLNDNIQERIKLLAIQGGYAEPLGIDFMFNNEGVSRKIPYLCYAQESGSLCMNQEPMLMQHLKNEMKDYLADDIRNCFDELTQSLESSGYVVDATYRTAEIDLTQKKALIKFDAQLALTKGDETTRHENFEVSVPTRIYELANAVHDILNKEADSCSFGNYGFIVYIIFHPQFNIERIQTANSDIIYIIQHPVSEEEFRFAVRNCV